MKSQQIMWQRFREDAEAFRRERTHGTYSTYKTEQF